MSLTRVVPGGGAAAIDETVDARSYAGKGMTPVADAARAGPEA